MNIDFAIGLHIAGCLASCSDELVSSRTMARSFGTSPVVLRRVLVRMNNAGLVDTKRGANGGSKLSRAASEINLKEIYESACQKVELFARHPQGAGTVSNILGGYINEFYLEAEKSMLSHLESLNLAEMDAIVRPQIMAALKCE